MASMLNLRHEAMMQTDIALLNLCCAANLPRNKNLDISSSLTTLDPFALTFLADAVQANLDRSPMFARRPARVLPRMPTMDESIRMADEVNVQNAETQSQWYHQAPASTPWPAMNPSGVMP